MKKPLKPIDNTSLTGYRLMAILCMLKERPHTDVEINDNLKKDINLSRSISKDSICLYVNTLRALGCQITRPSKKNGFNYILKDHPFKLNLNDQEIKSLIEVKKYVSNLSDLEISCNFDKFLNTVCNFLEEDNKKLIIKQCKIVSREIDYTLKTELIKELEYHCSKNSVISILYQSPSGNNSDIRLLTEYLKYDNGALYLWGYNIDIEETQYLRVDRIESVKELVIKDIEPIKQPLTVVFKLFGMFSTSYNPDENEKIIGRDSDSITIETKMKNRFLLIQKILSFGIDCEVIQPEELKNEIIKRLKSMVYLYNKPS